MKESRWTPIHVHIRKGKPLAKFWVEPDVFLSKSYGFSTLELRQFDKLVNKNKDLIIRSWNEYFRL